MSESKSLFEAACAAAPVGMEVAAVAARVPERIAIQSERGNLNFGELNRRVNALSHYLRSLGLQAGDALALVCSNRPEFCEASLACHRLGLRMTPVNWHLSAEEAAYVIRDCEAKVLIADDRAASAAALAKSQSPHIVQALAVDCRLEDFVDYESAIANFPGSDIDAPARGTVMQYTSGTTGRPKGVMRKQPDPAQAAGMQEILTAVFQYQPESGNDTGLVTGPLYHSGPYNLCMMTPLTAGIGIVIMDKWEPEATLALIERYRISHAFFVPTMFKRMLDLPDAVRRQYDLASLRFVIHGAAPCSIAVKQAMMEWFGPIIWELFAGTEGPGTMIGPDEWLARPGTVGKPAPDQVRILSESGERIPDGEEGQIWWQLPEASSFEYFKAPEKTRDAQRDGYFTAGDIGYLDDEGYLFLTGRSAETIISGGGNIYPQEIDDVLQQHPSVHDVACVGVPDDEWGERVLALVVLADGVEANETLQQELSQHCESQLAKQKYPRSFEWRDSIPRSAAGKVLRRQLREPFWQDRDRAI